MTAAVVSSDIKENKKILESDFADCSDFLLRECKVDGTQAIVCVLDGMVDSMQLSEMIMEPLLRYRGKYSGGAELFNILKTSVICSVEMDTAKKFADVYYYLSSGFAALFIDGAGECLVLGIQGFEKRSVDEPSNEADIKGAKECFTETLNDNKAMLRRRIKTPELKLKQINMGVSSKTPVVIAYIENIADSELVSMVEKRLVLANIRTVQDFGELEAFLNTDRKSYFSAVGNTERPDKLCSKLLEGRVAVLTDGSPFALFVPNLFTDNFSTVDDYDNLPFYATFNRLLKYFAFVISIILPGFYVAAGTFHQELIPTSLMYTIAAAEATTPFSLMQEALMILVLYEIMREAGLRLPKVIGHAVSIIGALVIGDAVVNAGLVGAPMLVVVAVTAIASYVVYPLYESIAVLRFVFILLGGFLGIYGIVLGVCVIAVNIASINPYGIPYTAPVSPLNYKSLGDIFYRESWKKLSKRKVKVQNLRGADVDKI
ncbi:MAG: spore germination protein [Clostridiales bacterium]|nr:spore germination protein [Clostridiales bacterium]